MNILKITIGLVWVLSMGACTEEEVLQPGAASLTVIHAVMGAEPLRTNFSGTSPIQYATANSLRYGYYLSRFNRFSLAPGLSRLGLFQGLDTLADSEPLFLVDLDLPEGSIHTLFLTGTVDAPESVLVRDEVPYFAQCDTMGIRFINLSPGSAPVSVNLADRNVGSEVAALPYRETTDFQRYPIEKGQEDYVFEFRQSETGELVTSYRAAGVGNDGALQPNTWLCRSFTLALIGRPEGTGDEAPRVLLIPYY